MNDDDLLGDFGDDFNILEFADALDGNDATKTNILDDLETDDSKEGEKDPDKPPPYAGDNDPSRPPPPPYPGPHPQSKVRLRLAWSDSVELKHVSNRHEQSKLLYFILALKSLKLLIITRIL